VSDSSYKRSWDDLYMYKSFFTELYEFDVSPDEFVCCASVFLHQFDFVLTGNTELDYLWKYRHVYRPLPVSVQFRDFRDF